MYFLFIVSIEFEFILKNLIVFTLKIELVQFFTESNLETDFSLSN